MSPKIHLLFFPALMAGLSGVRGDVLFSTGFENSEGYSAGSDKIAGSQGWLGTTSAGAGRSGIDAETTHGVPGLGNAGWIGGNTSPVTWAGSSINVRHPLSAAAPFYEDPAGAGKEIVFISVLVGLKDSGGGPAARRDNFELFIMNGASSASGAGDVLAAVQFDNTTLADGRAAQVVRRTQSAAGSKALTYVSTGAYFLYGTMQLLTVRINYRANLWSAALDDIPLFSDLPFYSGTGARNLGAVGFRMFFGSAVHQGSVYTCSGGDNYLLFDDLTVQADPPEAPAVTALTKSAGGTVSLTWNTEAGYQYQVFGSPDLTDWALLTPVPLTAAQTGPLSFSDSDSSGAARLSRFYKIARSFP